MSAKSTSRMLPFALNAIRGICQRDRSDRFFPFHQSLVRSRLGLPASFECANSLGLQTEWYVPASHSFVRSRCNETRLPLLGWPKDLSQPTIFLIPAFITFGS